MFKYFIVQLFVINCASCHKNCKTNPKRYKFRMAAEKYKTYCNR